MVGSVTVMVDPAPVEERADREEMIKSGPILMVVVLVLLLSLVSGMLVFASALAMRYQVPGVVPEGMVTVVLMKLRPPRSTLFPFPTLFRSSPVSRVELEDR